MDFTFSADQLALRHLASTVFGDQATAERLGELERSDERIDGRLWAAIASTGLLGIAVPEQHGGAGLGMVELALVLEAQGRAVAPVPLWPVALAAGVIAEFGAPSLCAAWLPDVLDGSTFATIAVEEWGTGDVSSPATRAESGSGGDWHLTGAKAAVPAGHVADLAVVSASTSVGPRLFCLELDGRGVTRERGETTNREICTNLALDGAEARPLALASAAALAWLVARARVALAALQLGVAEESLDRSAGYVTNRRQFDRPLGSFQAVAHHVADALIDVEAMGVTLWQAAWLLDRHLDATVAVPVAAWWAADAGSRVAHVAQHLHGGTGVDVNYPLHRYFLWATQLACTWGGAGARLEQLGNCFAEVRA